ncbi:MAG: histidine--tRNA ligase [Pseudomonadota bacterium]
MSKILPISGFPEFSPAEQIVFNRVMDVIRRSYERVGAVPIETSAVERIETLTAKGGNEKEIYALRRLAGEDGDDAKLMALRFDLTVPLARYAVQHMGTLTFPFRRYQMQPVWRGERPQAGRYRQFYQCDIDVIGDGTLSLINDAEMPVVIHRIFAELRIGPFMIAVNNRKILSGFLSSIGLESEADVGTAMKVVDSMEKVGTQQTRGQLRELGISEDNIDKLVEFFSLALKTDELLDVLRERVANATMQEGLDELETVVKYMRMMGLPEQNFRVDLSIARGLDYYTGTVYETRLTNHPGLGSICSGGRYEKLLRSLGADRDLPGVGISIGLTRLLPRLFEAGVMAVGPATVAPVLVTTMDPDQLEKYLKFGAVLRSAGINTEIYTEPKKLTAQMKYANRKGFSVVVIAGEEEFATDTVIVRRLVDGDQIQVAQRDLVTTVVKLLGGAE